MTEEDGNTNGTIPILAEDGMAEPDEETEAPTEEEIADAVEQRAKDGGYYEEFQRELEEIRRQRGEGGVQKNEDFRAAEVDDALFKAYDDAVWWGVDDDVDLSKAPAVWESLGELGDYIRDRIRDVVDQPDTVWTDYEGLDMQDVQTVRDVIEAEMTDPQGWTIGGLRDRFVEALNVDEEQAEDMARNESSAVINETREEILEDRDDDREYYYDWVGPNDHRTTDCCLWIEDQIDAEGGSVTMDRLKEILYEAAVKHQDDGGTPDRARDHQPHYNCRRTFRRDVQANY